MKIVAVVGTGSGCGKTTAACRILQAIPGLGAVKISPRDGVSRVEWGAGEPGKDTDLFFSKWCSTGSQDHRTPDEVKPTWERIKGHFEGCPAVVIEGASALDIPEERYVVFVIGDAQDEARKDRNRAIAAISDVIIKRSSHSDAESLVNVIHTFLTGSAT